MGSDLPNYLFVAENVRKIINIDIIKNQIIKIILIFSENQFCFLMCTPCNIEGNRSMAQPCAVSLESPARSAFRQVGCGLQQTSPKTVECFDAGLLPVLI
jgi:hypothetical protein